MWTRDNPDVVRAELGGHRPRLRRPAVQIEQELRGADRLEGGRGRVQGHLDAERPRPRPVLRLRHRVRERRIARPPVDRHRPVASCGDPGGVPAARTVRHLRRNPPPDGHSPLDRPGRPAELPDAQARAVRQTGGPLHQVPDDVPVPELRGRPNTRRLPARLDVHALEGILRVHEQDGALGLGTIVASTSKSKNPRPSPSTRISAS